MLHSLIRLIGCIRHNKRAGYVGQVGYIGYTGYKLLEATHALQFIEAIYVIEEIWIMGQLNLDHGTSQSGTWSM